MKVIFDELAEEEFNDAVEYYELQVEGLGRRFKEEVRLERLKTIQRLGSLRKVT